MNPTKSSTQSFRFVVAFIFAMMVVFVGYGFLFRYRIMRDPVQVPKTYQQLLVEKVQGPRVIFESGSSAYHAIDSRLVEQLLGYSCIILSDHAVASLEDKIERLMKYAQAGDVIVFPLEWNYYHAPDLTGYHLGSLFNKGREYYYSLPLFKQWLRAYKMPLKLVIAELMNDGELRTTDYLEELDHLKYFSAHHLQFQCNGGAGEDKDTLCLPEDSFCDGYILPELVQGSIPLHRDFKTSIRLMGQLVKQNQVTVIVIPPVVCGADCYDHYGTYLEPLLHEAETLCRQVGVHMLSDYRRYDVDVQYLLDTHFHIKSEARADVTAMIVGDLVANGWVQPKPNDSAGSTVVEQMPEILDAELWDLKRVKMPVWKGNPTAIVDADDQPEFDFDLHWYEEETWGRWAAEANASIVFRPDPGKPFSGLFVNANYFNGSQKTKVYVNDTLAGEIDFTKDHLLEFPNGLKALQGDDPLVRLRFESHDLVSPADLGNGTDTRKIKFGLHSLELFSE